MTDLSHWDFADRFRGKEAAELILGIPPESNDGWEQILGGSNGFTAKITPVLRRMEHALNEAGEQLYQAAMSGIPVKVALEAFPLLPHGLQSETMQRARTSETEFGLSIFKDWHPKFDGRFGDAYFNRAEIVRWLQAIGMQSAYQFEKNPGRNESIFNVPDDVSEEFRQWLLMETWPYESAMWLLAGVIPREIYEGFGFFKTNFKMLHNDNGEKDDKIHKIGNLKRLWLSNPANPESAAPSVYLAWAAEKKIDVDWLESVRREGYLMPDETFFVTEQKPIGTKRWPWGDHHTELLGHLEAAALEFWVKYDPQNAKATAPKNENVIAWLIARKVPGQKRNVSTQMAGAIATMLRPDDLPTGPRK